MKILIPLAALLLTACSKEKSVQELRQEDEKNFAEQAKQLPDIQGSLTLTYNGETITADSFDKTASNLIFSSKGKISVNLVSMSGDIGRRLLISFPHEINSPPFTGTYMPGDGARFAANGFIGNEASAISLSEGSINITKCDKQGNFALEFEGKGGALAKSPQEFSGKLELKNLQVVQY